MTSDPQRSGDYVERDWRYFSTAVGWYEPRDGLTGAQIFGVIQRVQQALQDGRITPADLGIEVPNAEYVPQTIRLQDVTDKALLTELLRRLGTRDIDGTENAAVAAPSTRSHVDTADSHPDGVTAASRPKAGSVGSTPTEGGDIDGRADG